MSVLSEYTGRTTLLQAVNVGMRALGVSKVNSLDSSDLNADARDCLSSLGETMREVSQEGWDFNTEVSLDLDANDDTGEIVLPWNTLKVVETYYPGAQAKNLVERDGKLYDTIGHTFNIGQTVTVHLTVGVDWDTLPEAARWYITLRAARRLASIRSVSASVFKFTKDDENEARGRFEQAMNDNESQTTMANNPHFRRTRRRS